MTAPIPTLQSRSRRRQSGSAYIITLLALVVLTIVGLSLSVITQSELIIGANERVEKRTFYAADSGISHSLARALVDNDYEAAEITVDDLGSRLSNARFEVSMSPLLPVSMPPCNLCQVNNGGQYNAANFQAPDFVATSTAVRRAGPFSGPLASKTVSSMLQVQPMQLPSEAVEVASDPDQTSLLKF